MIHGYRCPGNKIYFMPSRRSTNDDSEERQIIARRSISVDIASNSRILMTYYYASVFHRVSRTSVAVDCKYFLLDSYGN